jgi:hypothetical protein
VRSIIQYVAILACAVACVSQARAGITSQPVVPAKIMHANTVYIECVCPRGLAAARQSAVQELENWGRFQITEDPRQADLVFLFSGNPYLGDYLTRDGPDTRPVAIKNTIMTVIDPMTGATVWTDTREWGSWRVAGAAKDLIVELRQQMESQTKHWSLAQIQMCGVTPVYAGFAHLTQEEALAKSDGGTRNVSGSADRLQFTSTEAPDFCKSAEFIFNADHRIVGFEVLATRADDLNFGEILQHADQFNISGGKYTDTNQVYVLAQSKDKKLRIQFDVEGKRSLLSKVSFFYQ